MDEWLERGSVPDDDELADQLTSLMYGYDNAFRKQLESKKDAKARGIASPDKADSLALTFIPDLVALGEIVNKTHARAPSRRSVVWSNTSVHRR